MKKLMGELGAPTNTGYITIYSNVQAICEYNLIHLKQERVIDSDWTERVKGTDGADDTDRSSSSWASSTLITCLAPCCRCHAIVRTHETLSSHTGSLEQKQRRGTFLEPRDQEV